MLHPNTVAPAGHFTDFCEDEFHISQAWLDTEATFPDDNWIIVNSELIKIEWPYLTLRVTKWPPNDVTGRSSGYLIGIGLRCGPLNAGGVSRIKIR